MNTDLEGEVGANLVFAHIFHRKDAKPAKKEATTSDTGNYSATQPQHWGHHAAWYPQYCQGLPDNNTNDTAQK